MEKVALWGAGYFHENWVEPWQRTPPFAGMSRATTAHRVKGGTGIEKMAAHAKKWLQQSDGGDVSSSPSTRSRRAILQAAHEQRVASVNQNSSLSSKSKQTQIATHEVRLKAALDLLDKGDRYFRGVLWWFGKFGKPLLDHHNSFADVAMKLK